MVVLPFTVTKTVFIGISKAKVKPKIQQLLFQVLDLSAGVATTQVFFAAVIMHQTVHHEALREQCLVLDNKIFVEPLVLLNHQLQHSICWDFSSEVVI